MEANEAPEKIYCVTTEGGYYLTAIKSEPPFAEAVEYTRTDAFIEKTCEWIKRMWSETNDRFNEDFTGMLIENFKNYLKGE